MMNTTVECDEQSESGATFFPDLVNRAAFADKVVLSVWGYRLAKSRGEIQLGPNQAIGGDGRLYARLIPIALPKSGNLGQLKYGRLLGRRWVPPFRLIVRSVNTPLDQAQVALVLSSLFRTRYRNRVAEVEMTFDSCGDSIRSLQQKLFTPARRFREVRDQSGSETFYAGGPTSSWQLRVYQKTHDVVRIEFILRRPLLRNWGIHTFEDVVLLRSVDLRRLASFMSIHESKLCTTLADMEPGWRKQVLLDWPVRRPLQPLTQTLRREYRIDPALLLYASDTQLRLERMQPAFIW
jgi:hypothetical protein